MRDQINEQLLIRTIPQITRILIGYFLAATSNKKKLHDIESIRKDYNNVENRNICCSLRKGQ